MQTFSSKTAAIYIFNLVVGTGALALPNAFDLAGLGLGTGLLLLLALFSYTTASFVVESMAACNGIKTIEQIIQRRKIQTEVNDESDTNDQEDPSYEDFQEDEHSSLLKISDSRRENISRYGSTDTACKDKIICNIGRKLEMGEMADMLFNTAGRLAFSILIVAYLFGDLAINCTAVAKSLRDVTCTHTNKNNLSTTTPSYALDLTDPCWDKESLTRTDAYRIYVAIFYLLIGPFAFFNVTKTKYLQIFTTILRWAAFGTMMILATMRIADSSSVHGSPKSADFSATPHVFGVAVYAFMCHHSIPSVVSPIKNKSSIASILATDYLLITTFYLALAYTGTFAFPNVPDLYTLAFQPQAGSNPSVDLRIVDYFLTLFPVFTLSTNWPVLAITLRNNLETMFTDFSICSNMSTTVKRLIFPLLATIPPILLALGTEDLAVLVTITGAYAGVGIQFVIPCSLVFFARRRLRTLESNLNSDIENPLESLFKHASFVFLVLAMSLIAVGLVTAKFIMNSIKSET